MDVSGPPADGNGCRLAPVLEAERRRGGHGEPAGRAGPYRGGSAVISAGVSMAWESEKSDAHISRLSDVRGLARPMVSRIQICSQSPVYGQ